MAQNWETLLLLTDIFDSDELFRTKIQKILYFASQHDVIDNSFKKGLYGPYSPEVANNLETLVEVRFLKENSHYFSNGYMGYSYELTKEGQEVLPSIREKKADIIPILTKIIEECKDKTSDELSKAAKIHFILQKSKGVMLPSDIVEAARELKWTIPGDEIASATDLLLKIELVKQSS